MCVGAALGLSTKAVGGAFLSQAAAFNIGLGLTVANAFAGRAAAKSKAQQTYQQGLLANQSIEDDKRQKQLALAEKKSEEEKSAAQDMFAKNIDTLVANRAIVASEQSGTTVNLLLMDTDRQGANYRESVNQSIASMQRQYLFNIQQTESEYLTRKNKIQSNINEAYNAIPSLGSTLLNIGTGALSSYTNALAIG
ncbi:hypothetical protein [uncultured phage MedDCM-OCT-S08-C151]|nr:hypothetical protein [uncultured phage MedDCM-OCT-S08-C151]